MKNCKAISSDDIETQKRVEALFNPVPISKAMSAAIAVATSIAYGLISQIAAPETGKLSMWFGAFMLGSGAVFMIEGIWRMGVKAIAVAGYLARLAGWRVSRAPAQASPHR